LKFSFTVGKVNFNHSIVVYLNGTPVPSAGNWEIDASTATQLVWAVAPSEGQVITMDFYFYYLCRFISDEQEFEQFVKNWWTAPIKFRSINTSIDIPVHGAHWVIFGLETPVNTVPFPGDNSAFAGSSAVVGSTYESGVYQQAQLWDLATLSTILTISAPSPSTFIDATSVDAAGTRIVGGYTNQTTILMLITTMVLSRI
jgi:hypothetical protein